MFPRTHLPYSLHSRRHRRRHGKPEYRRNIPSAFFGLVVTGLFAVTMAEPNWFHLSGGICTGKHIGLYTIFGVDKSQLKSACITPMIITKLRVCAALCFIAIITSMFQFSLDVCGANKKGLKCLRRNSAGNIVSVLLAIVVMLICYWITVDISQIRLQGNIIVTSRLDVAFYLIIGAGIAAIVATSLSLLQITCEKQERRQHSRGSDMQLQLIQNHEQESDLHQIPPIPPPLYEP